MTAQRIEPTRLIALKIWWAFTWRSLVFCVSIGFVLGFVLAVAAQALGMLNENTKGLLTLIGLPLGPIVTVEVMYRILRKKFKDFEIVLVPHEGAQEQ